MKRRREVVLGEDGMGSEKEIRIKLSLVPNAGCNCICTGYVCTYVWKVGGIERGESEIEMRIPNAGCNCRQLLHLLHVCDDLCDVN